jgi:hypothetical protein
MNVDHSVRIIEDDQQAAATSAHVSDTEQVVSTSAHVSDTDDIQSELHSPKTSAKKVQGSHLSYLVLATRSRQKTRK